MAELFDKDGNPVQGALDPNEAKALQDAAAEAAALKEKLGKMENKEFNFKKLRDMTTEEQAKLSAKEMDLIKRQEKLEEDQNNFTKKMQDSYRDAALAQAAGDDEETRKKVLHHYDRIKDEAATPQEIAAKMRDAATLAGVGKRIEANPLFAAHGVSGDAPKNSSGAPSQEVKQLGKALGLSEDELKNLK